MNLYKSFCVVEKELFTKAYLPNLFNNRPGHLLNFWILRVGAYSRWALSPFSASEVCLFCNQTINANNKT